MFDELVGPTDPDDGCLDLAFGEQFHHGTAVAARQRMILDRDDHVGRAPEELVGTGIQRLGESGIDQGDVEILALQMLGRFTGQALHVAQGKDGDLNPTARIKVSQDFRLADFDQARRFFDGHALGRAAGIADRGGMPLLSGGEEHVHQLILVLGRHQDHVGHAAEIRNIVKPMMRGPVVGRQPRAVHAENHRQILQCGVVDDAIIGALQERRVNRAHGVETHRREPAGEEHAMFLRDADVVIAVGQGLFEDLESGAAGHCRRNANDRVILAAQPHHGLPKHILPVWRGARLGRRARPGLHVVGTGAVEFLGMLESDVVALALFGEHMEHNRLLAGLGVFEDVDQEWDIMAVNRPHVTQAHLLEDQAAAEPASTVALERSRALLEGHLRDRAFEGFFGLVTEADRDVTLGEAAEQPLEVLLEPVVGGMSDQSVEVGGDGANVLGDAPLVVIQDANEPLRRV